MNKLVIVINGRGGVGKDALCSGVESVYRVSNISAITPIKEIASNYGWTGDKDNKSRRFLSQLKRVFSEYNDLPNNYLLEKYNEFLNDDRQLLFVHIRESEQINHFISFIKIPCITLLIRRKEVDLLSQYGNESDDDVANYSYDYYFDNDLPYEESKEQFIAFIKKIWYDLYKE